MNEEHRRRKVVAAQGFAAVAFFVFAHGAHAATTQSHAQARPDHRARPRALSFAARVEHRVRVARELTEVL
jgi:predicted lipoprotein